jgi:hypothetical protein
MVFVFELDGGATPRNNFEARMLHDALLRDSSTSSPASKASLASSATSVADERPYGAAGGFAAALNCYP